MPSMTYTVQWGQCAPVPTVSCRPSRASNRTNVISLFQKSHSMNTNSKMKTTDGRVAVRGRGLVAVQASASGGDKPAILVNSCTGKMGHATAEAVVRAGLTLVPYTFTGRSEAVAVGNVGVCGVPVELITPQERQTALEQIKADYPDLVVIDYTLPSAVNGTLIYLFEIYYM